jgi:hypothetical protein
VDDIVEAASLAAFPVAGETGKIYVALDSGMTYRWSGTTYVAISDKVVAAGITDSTVIGRAVVTAVDAPAARRATGTIDFYDVRQFGAKCDGTTDDTAAWAAAVTAVSAAGGGLIWWRGDSVVTQIALKAKVGMCGLGTNVSRIVHKVGRAAGQHCITLTEADARHVVLRDFNLHGNRSSQTGLANGIHFNNSTSASSGHCHMIRNVRVESVAGTGIYMGYNMRGSLIDNVNAYFCDEYGMHLASFSDNSVQNVDIGQSGSHGLYIQDSWNVRFGNIKCWYSGRLTGTGAGMYQRGGGINIFSNIATQENKGHGFLMFGYDVNNPISGVVVRGFNSDSDNTANTTSYSALQLDGVKNSIFEVAVTSFAPAKTKPQHGAFMTATATNNRVVVYADPAVLKSDQPAAAANYARNSIDMCRVPTDVTPAGTYTPTIFLNDEFRLTLNAALTVGNPAITTIQPPVGLRIRIITIQDATGGKAVTWGNHFRLPTVVPVTTGDTRTIYDFECQGFGDWVLTGFTTGIPARVVLATAEPLIDNEFDYVTEPVADVQLDEKYQEGVSTEAGVPETATAVVTTPGDAAVDPVEAPVADEPAPEPKEVKA